VLLALVVDTAAVAGPAMRGVNLPGSNHPKATNKSSVSAEGTFPVQSGKADFSLSVTATSQPDCTPPMTVVSVDITVTDTTNGISLKL